MKLHMYLNFLVSRVCIGLENEPLKNLFETREVVQVTRLSEKRTTENLSV